MSVGYSMKLASMPPFMYVECHKTRGPLGVIAFGAYNAMGLIGPEKGGIALVLEPPNAQVLATLDVPYEPKKRADIAKRLLKGKTAVDIVRRAIDEGGFAWRFDTAWIIREVDK